METLNLLDTITTRMITAGDGVSLCVRELGSAHGPPVLMLHGLGQSGAAWYGAARGLAARGLFVRCPDFRGHGASARMPSAQYQLTHFLDDVALLCGQCDRPPIIVGASLGGMLGLLQAAAHPDCCRALVLVDITPRWEAAGVARILDFMRARPDGFASLDEAESHVRQYLRHRRNSKSRAQLAELFVEGPDGRFRWHWDPALVQQISAQADTHGQRLLAAAARLTVPTLLLSGALSDVVSQRGIDEFLAAAPHAQHRQISGARHMLAGDNNDAFNAALLAFLEPIGWVGGEIAEIA